MSIGSDDPHGEGVRQPACLLLFVGVPHERRDEHDEVHVHGSGIVQDSVGDGSGVRENTTLLLALVSRRDRGRFAQPW